MERESNASCIILVWAPRKWGPFLCSKSSPDPSTCSPPAPRRKRGHRRPNLTHETQYRPNAHARPYRPENSPHRATETAPRSPRTAYDPRQPPALGGPRRPAAAPGGLVNRFKLNALPADSPLGSVFSASPKIRHDAHASYPQISLRPVFSASRKSRHDARASTSGIPPLAVFSAALETRHDARASCSGILTHRFFQRTQKLVMMRTRAVLNLSEVFPATSEIRHDARAKTQNVVAYPSDTCYAFANGAQAQNREPHERRIGGHNGTMD